MTLLEELLKRLAAVGASNRHDDVQFRHQLMKVSMHIRGQWWRKLCALPGTAARQTWICGFAPLREAKTTEILRLRSG